MKKIALLIVTMATLFSCKKDEGSQNCWRCVNTITFRDYFDSTRSTSTYFETLCDKSQNEITAYQENHTYPSAATSGSSTITGPDGTVYTVITGRPYGSFNNGNYVEAATSTCSELK